MAVFRPIQVQCPCGQAFTADAARSVNIRRNPAVRQDILAGRFQQLMCPGCGGSRSVERPFYYSDPDRRAVFLVLPRGERLNHSRDGRRISQQESACRTITLGKAPRQMRVVYGLDELREKLVAQDAGMDDRHVEMLKLFVLHDHPFLLRTARLQLVLAEAGPTHLNFVAYHHNQLRRYAIRVSRFSAESFVAAPGAPKAWADAAGHQEPLFAPERRWVNFRRWTTRYPALDALRDMAASVSKGEALDLQSPAFVRMCELLPRGANLSGTAKGRLQTLFDYAKRVGDGAAQDRLFEVRYGIELDDEWSTNQDAEDIDTIWKLLRNVPPSNIEGNTHLKEIEAIEGGGGLYQWSGVIQIGSDELRDKERFEDVLRHEVGHAVHAQRAAQIDAWLADEFGWQRLGRTQEAIDAWVDVMGGWEAWGPVSASQRVQISNALVEALGQGASWKPGRQPRFAANHPWNRPNFGPRLAVEGSHEDWYASFGQWQRANGLAFFLNYWYAELFVVKESTLDLIAQMPDAYAAMSHFEFFAELYALHYDLDDPARTIVPKRAAKWMDQNLGKPKAAPTALPAKTAKASKSATAVKATKATKLTKPRAP